MKDSQKYYKELKKFSRTHDAPLEIVEPGILLPPDGAKGEDSTVSNIKRSMGKITKLRQVNDLDRAAWVFRTFSEMYPYIDDLGAYHPEMIAKIKNNEASGYGSFNLNFTVNGIPSEIKCITPEIGSADKTQHSLFATHRELAEYYSNLLEQFYASPAKSQERQFLKEKIDVLKTTPEFKKYMTDYEDSRQLFESAKKTGDFYDNIREMRALVVSLSERSRPDLTPRWYDYLLDTRLTHGNVVDEPLTRQVFQDVNPEMQKNQENLVDQVTEIFKKRSRQISTSAGGKKDRFKGIQSS